MDINVAQLAKDALSAALGAAKGQAGDLKNYLEARAQLIAQGAKDIAADRLAGKITDDDVKFAFDQIKQSENASLDAIDATAKAAAQDAINAALGVVAAAINKAIGVAIL